MNTSTMTTMQPNDEKWIGVAAGLAASVVPQVISAIRSRRKDFAPEVMPAAPAGAGDGDDADAEQKWVAALARAVVPAAISAAPGLINAVRGRGKDAAVGLPATGGMGAEDAEGEEKWVGLAAGIAASVLPQVISTIRSRRKDFAPEVMPAAPAGAGDGDDADAEQKWVAALARAVVPAAISAAPGLINAVRGRGKDAAVGFPATGGMGAEDAEGEEKWVGLAAGVAASVLPQVISAIRSRRKDFAPEVMPAAPAGVGNGATDDAEQKWVAALARAVVPAAISAAPGLINAVRGKDFAPDPAPVLADQQRSVEGFTTEDEKVLRAMAPVVAATLPAVAQAMRGGTDRRYRAAI